MKYEICYIPFTMRTNLIPTKGYKDEWIIDIPWQLHDEILVWCRENFGDPGRDRRYLWRTNGTATSVFDAKHNDSSEYNNLRIFLRNEVDVTLFVLKWANISY